MQMAFSFEQRRCIGCFACVTACMQWHQHMPGKAKRRRLLTLEEGKYPNVSVRFLSSACCHCAEPACVGACPAEAIHKRDEDGIVILDREVCLGAMLCGFACRDACPHDAPQFESEGERKMQKCDFCMERLSEGKKPICVEACITGALDAGPLKGPDNP
jgi:anaerobic dimethyl sulfoxide reductase subunit B (iron-sulfur subunit)